MNCARTKGRCCIKQTVSPRKYASVKTAGYAKITTPSLHSLNWTLQAKQTHAEEYCCNEGSCTCYKFHLMHETVKLSEKSVRRHGVRSEAITVTTYGIERNATPNDNVSVHFHCNLSGVCLRWLHTRAGPLSRWSRVPIPRPVGRAHCVRPLRCPRPSNGARDI